MDPGTGVELTQPTEAVGVHSKGQTRLEGEHGRVLITACWNSHEQGLACAAMIKRSTSDEGFGAEIRRIIDQHAGSVEAAAKRVLGSNYAQALDALLEEVRIAVWQSLKRGDRIDHWSGFIYDCAHKRALDLWRQDRRRSRFEVALSDLPREPGDAEQCKTLGAPVGFAVADDELRLLDAELAKLPESIRLVVFLRKAEGYSRKEVARMLRCSQPTVDYRLRVGIRRLKRALKRV